MSAALPRFPTLRLLGATLLAATMLRAATPGDEVRAADTARVMATIAGQVDRLDPLLSSGLIYAHADGRVQTKAEFLAAVKSGRIKYDSYDYDDVKITPVTDEVVIMTGRARLRATAGAVSVAFSLRFQSVWRREDGAWRLFAYQSAKLAEPAVVPPAK
ncbi:MAG: nuclear transport factor 2 family protein [Verrucomicrobia bacterium]|nr:nuclear transport factor 2 family protein [Verrucomicrobiota bacterium]